MSVSNLEYTVDVAKAILGAGGLFKNSHTVVWEYVVNGIQYREKKTNPQIYVIFKKDKIIIKDNGLGMDLKGLKNFLLYMVKMKIEKLEILVEVSMEQENQQHLQLQIVFLFQQ